MTEWEHEEEGRAVARRRGCVGQLAEAGPAAELEEAEAAEAGGSGLSGQRSDLYKKGPRGTAH